MIGKNAKMMMIICFAFIMAISFHTTSATVSSCYVTVSNDSSVPPAPFNYGTVGIERCIKYQLTCAAQNTTNCNSSTWYYGAANIATCTNFVSPPYSVYYTGVYCCDSNNCNSPSASASNPVTTNNQSEKSGGGGGNPTGKTSSSNGLISIQPSIAWSTCMAIIFTIISSLIF